MTVKMRWHGRWYSDSDDSARHHTQQNETVQGKKFNSISLHRSSLPKPRQQSSEIFHVSFHLMPHSCFSRDTYNSLFEKWWLHTASHPHIIAISIAVSYTSHHQDSLQRRWIGNKWMRHEIGNRKKFVIRYVRRSASCSRRGEEFVRCKRTKRGTMKNIFQWFYIQFSTRLISSIDNTSSKEINSPLSKLFIFNLIREFVQLMHTRKFIS